MNENDQEEVIVDDLEETNEEEGVAEEKPAKADKPKRTPQEEYEYHNGRAQRLAKKLGIKGEGKVDSVKDTPNEKPNDLDMGGIAYLSQLTGLKGKAEIALAREYIANGKSIMDLPENKFFIQDLQTLRDSAEVDNASIKGKGRSSQSAVTDLDLVYAKFKETGEWPSNFETAKKLKDRIVTEDKGAGSIYK